MPATKVGIVYSVALRKRRWMVIPDHDNELPLPTKAGEAYVEQPMADYRQRGPDAAVQDAAGGPPLSDVCAVISANAVTHLVAADPAIDTIAGATLTLSTIAQPGDTVSGQTFVRRWIVANKATGIVSQVLTSDATKPPAPTALTLVLPSLALQVGDVAFVPGTVDSQASVGT